TLAAESYAKQTSVIDALIHIVDEMPNYIKVKYSEEHRKNIKWVENPVNSEENFADKWPENPVKEDNFFKWHNKLKEDLNLIFSKVGTGINEVQKAFSSSFGEKTINKVFENYGQSLTTKRDDGLVRMASESGLLGAVGTKVKKHNFEGNSG
ncbi:MAG: nucleotidyltransferase, partial [Vicingaceae bacterium]